MTYNKERSQPIETDPQITEIIELVEKHIKTAMINVFQLPKDIKKTMSTMIRKIKDYKTC